MEKQDPDSRGFPSEDNSNSFNGLISRVECLYSMTCEELRLLSRDGFNWPTSRCCKPASGCCTSNEECWLNELLSAPPESNYFEENDRAQTKKKKKSLSDEDSEKKLESLHLFRELERLSSFSGWYPAHENIVSPAILAKKGFYYLGKKDHMKCFFCNTRFIDWTSKPNPSKVLHHCCCMLRRPLNIPVSLETENEQMHKYSCTAPEVPQFQNYGDRRDSYAQYNGNFNVSPDRLADAGFSYFATKNKTFGTDRVKCFHCGGILQNWGSGDDPWIKHAIYFPTCSFLLQQKGQRFVHKHLSRYADYPRPIIPKQHWFAEVPTTSYASDFLPKFGKCMVSLTSETGGFGNMGRLHSLHEVEDLGSLNVRPDTSFLNKNENQQGIGVFGASESFSAPTSFLSPPNQSPDRSMAHIAFPHEEFVEELSDRRPSFSKQHANGWSNSISLGPDMDRVQRSSSRDGDDAQMVLGAAAKNVPELATDESLEVSTASDQLNSPHHPHMCRQSRREATFGRGWPSGRLNATISEITEAGFFYLGVQDRVKCFYCNGGLQNWETDDKPWIEHAKWFPNCQFLLQEKEYNFVRRCLTRGEDLPHPNITGQHKENHMRNQNQEESGSAASNNNGADTGGSICHIFSHGARVVDSFDSGSFGASDCGGFIHHEFSQGARVVDDFDSGSFGALNADFNARRETFENLPREHVLKSQDFPSAGFYYTGERDWVKCACCRRVVENWGPCDNPLDKKWHRSTCAMIRNRSSDSVVHNSSDYGLEPVPGARVVDAIASEILVPNVYADVHARQRTFESLPEDHILRRTVFPLASFFYYTGVLDRVKCFSCGRQVENWGDGDNPHDKKWHKSSCGILDYLDSNFNPSFLEEEETIPKRVFLTGDKMQNQVHGVSDRNNLHGNETGSETRSRQGEALSRDPTRAHLYFTIPSLRLVECGNMSHSLGVAESRGSMTNSALSASTPCHGTSIRNSPAPFDLSPESFDFSDNVENSKANSMTNSVLSGQASSSNSTGTCSGFATSPLSPSEREDRFRLSEVDEMSNIGGSGFQPQYSTSSNSCDTKSSTSSGPSNSDANFPNSKRKGWSTSCPPSNNSRHTLLHLTTPMRRQDSFKYFGDDENSESSSMTSIEQSGSQTQSSTSGDLCDSEPSALPNTRRRRFTARRGDAASSNAKGSRMNFTPTVSRPTERNFYYLGGDGNSNFIMETLSRAEHVLNGCNCVIVINNSQRDGVMNIFKQLMIMIATLFGFILGFGIRSFSDAA